MQISHYAGFNVVLLPNGYKSVKVERISVKSNYSVGAGYKHGSMREMFRILNECGLVLTTYSGITSSVNDITLTVGRDWDLICDQGETHKIVLNKNILILLIKVIVL